MLEQQFCSAFRGFQGFWNRDNQQYYVDLSMDAKWYEQKTYNMSCVGNLDLTDQNLHKLPDIIDTNQIFVPKVGVNSYSEGGCGAGMAPSGKYYARFNGGHNGIYVKALPDMKINSQATQEGAIPLTDHGKYNGWSCNSDGWMVHEMNYGGQDETHSDQFLIHWQNDIVKINTTKNSAGTWSDRGDAWISSMSEINENLKHFVINKTLWKTYWDKVLAGTPATLPVASSATLKPKPARARNAVVFNGHPVRADIGDATHVVVYNSQGRLIARKTIDKNMHITITTKGIGIFLLEFENSEGQLVSVARFVN